MIQETFAGNAVAMLQNDESVIGLAVGGSWITGELDEYSDLDLVLVTKEKISTDRQKMIQHAGRFGKLLAAFTGEHVGEPRLLICLYDDPLLHVDIKFVTLEEFADRIETPHILLDKHGGLAHVIQNTEPVFSWRGYQWIEDRFWTWVHYAAVKIARGELMEAFDFFSDIRRMVLGPLLHIKNGKLPKAVRKIEMQLPAHDLEKLRGTIPSYTGAALVTALENAVELYRDLSRELFTDDILRQAEAEKKVMACLQQLKAVI
jgi:predicted nucleotidyltransferase